MPLPPLVRTNVVRHQGGRRHKGHCYWLPDSKCLPPASRASYCQSRRSCTGSRDNRLFSSRDIAASNSVELVRSVLLESACGGTVIACSPSRSKSVSRFSFSVAQPLQPSPMFGLFLDARPAIQKLPLWGKRDDSVYFSTSSPSLFYQYCLEYVPVALIGFFLTAPESNLQAPLCHNYTTASLFVAGTSITAGASSTSK